MTSKEAALPWRNGAAMGPANSLVRTSVHTRSQDLEKGGGGLFWMSEKSANDLDPNFHCSESVSHSLSENLDEISRKARKFEGFFRPKSGGLQKKKKQKKKGLLQNWDWFFGRNSKFKGFFRSKSGGFQKKKGLRRNWDWFFGQIRKFKRLRGGCFPMGGAIFNFSQKIGLKNIKNVRFCILHKPMGEARAPPGYATASV